MFLEICLVMIRWVSETMVSHEGIWSDMCSIGDDDEGENKYLNPMTQTCRRGVKRGGSSCSEDKTRDVLLWPCDAKCL